MTAVHFVVPDAYDDPLRPSGGNVYDRRLCEALRQRGCSVQVHTVPGPWPSCSGSARLALARVLASIPQGAPVVVDGLIGSGMPHVLLPESDRLRLVALVHMPLGSVRGSGVATARARERAVLERSAFVIATSHWSRHWLLDHYTLSPASVVIAEPGADRGDLAEGTPSGGALLCVGAVTPVKGQDVLVEALARLGELDWTCTLMGSTSIDPGFAHMVADAARRQGIDERVGFRGPLSGAYLDSAYAAADLLVLPSRAEAYGMVVTEALGRGLPVIGSDIGGVSEAFRGRPPGHDTPHIDDGHTDNWPGPVSDPGILVSSDDPASLAGALRHWLVDADWRAELRRRAAARRLDLVPWSVTAERVSEVLDALTDVPVGR